VAQFGFWCGVILKARAFISGPRDLLWDAVDWREIRRYAWSTSPLGMTPRESHSNSNWATTGMLWERVYEFPARGSLLISSLMDV